MRLFGRSNSSSDAVLRVTAVFQGGSEELGTSHRASASGDRYLEFDGTRFRYRHEAEDKTLILPSTDIHRVRVLDGKCRPFAPGKKPGRGLVLEFASGPPRGDIARFKIFAWRGSSYRRFAATALALNGRGLKEEWNDGDTAALIAELPWMRFEGLELLTPSKRALVLSQYAKLWRLYPRAAWSIGSLRVEEIKSKKQCLGITRAHSEHPTGIALSAEHLDPKKELSTDENLLLAEAMSLQPAGCSDFRAVVSHEFGHALQWALESGPAGKIWVSRIDEALPAQAASAISPYARTNRSERFAEAFAMLQHAPPDRLTDPLRRLAAVLEEAYGPPGSFRPLPRRAS